MKEYNEGQYDDDLTVGSDAYDDSSYSDPVDLFEFSASEEAPISRLKSLVLSIDWEITDEVLLQFNEELNDLKGIWAGEKINLVYVQALEKISKYIFQHKADSHPNAIKLLLSLYYNLEKIVSSEDLTEEQKKTLLIEDVKKFEGLKKHIAQQSKNLEVSGSPIAKEREVKPKVKEKGPLYNLKAIVYAIDWEITDKDLDDLREEVVRLEKKFTNSKPKLILLQGIGTLGVYIKVKKSDAHADAFKLLHLFYESLEKTVDGDMNLEDEKAILFPAVKEFNDFKAMLGSTISPEKVKNNKEEDVEELSFSEATIVPAFSDIAEEESEGFQAEVEAQNLGDEASTNVVSHIDDFFADSIAKPGNNLASVVETGGQVDSEIALQGVDVEENGASDTEAIEVFSTPATSTLESGPEPVLSDVVDSAPMDALSELETLPKLEVDKDVALQGVDVESEADDDSDEEALPQGTDGIAPALVANEEEASAFSENILEDPTLSEDDVFSEISGTLDGFFGSDDDTPQLNSVSESDTDELKIPEQVLNSQVDESDSTFAVDRDVALQGVDVETEADDDSDEQALPVQAGALAPALSDKDEVSTFSETTVENSLAEDSEIQKITGKLDGFFSDDDGSIPAVMADTGSPVAEDDIVVEFSDPVEKEEISVGDELDDFFDDTKIEQNETLGVAAITESTADSIEVELSEDSSISEPPSVDDEVVTFFEVDDEEKTEVFSEELLTSTEAQETTQLIDLPGTTIMATDERETGEKVVVFELADEFDNEEKRDTIETPKTEAYVPPKVRIKPVQLGPYKAVKGSDSIEKVPESQSYDMLCLCVDAFEIEDKCFDEFYKEIASLNQVLTSTPAEKTFLCLLSTVVRHIDHFRADADGGALGLLKSVTHALTDLPQNQELLMTETAKVLEWQQSLLMSAIDGNSKVVTATDGIELSGAIATEITSLRADFKTEIATLRNEMKELLSS